jgi:hypothetical protein
LFEKFKPYFTSVCKGKFVIRIDLQVLPSDDIERKLKGFAIFEQIGACIL